MLIVLRKYFDLLIFFVVGDSNNGVGVTFQNLVLVPCSVAAAIIPRKKWTSQ